MAKQENNHPFADETLLARWLSGEVNEAERLQVESHPDFPEWQRIATTAAGWAPAPYAEEDAWKKLAERKAAAKVKPLKPRSSRRKWLVGVAAAVALITAVIFLLPGVESIKTNAGQRITHELPAGSRVELNAVSELRYAGKEWANKRAVELEGEAFFSVAKGSPFLVTTAMGTVEVLGTEFNVFARPEGFRVACYEGIVAVSLEDGRKDTLVAGQQLHLSQGQLLLDTIPPQTTTPGWLEGGIRYRDAAPEEVFQEMERQFGLSIN
ncbi:MAG: FecR domain-containing protein, partial [Bacteroidota bacterium]